TTNRDKPVSRPPSAAARGSAADRGYRASPPPATFSPPSLLLGPLHPQHRAVAGDDLQGERLAVGLLREGHLDLPLPCRLPPAGHGLVAVGGGDRAVDDLAVLLDLEAGPAARRRELEVLRAERLHGPLVLLVRMDPGLEDLRRQRALLVLGRAQGRTAYRQ